MPHWLDKILLAIIVLDCFIGWRVFVLLRPVKRRWIWRLIYLLFLLITVLFAWVDHFHRHRVGSFRDPVPAIIIATLYVYHMIVAPVLLLGLLLDLTTRVMRWVLRGTAGVKKPPRPADLNYDRLSSQQQLAISRRNFLVTSALAVPPIASVALGGVGLSQIGQFRVRRMALGFADWPAALDGYTISVVSDVHVGCFSTQKMLDDIVAVTNNLGADLIVLPGDLINASLTDLPAGLDMVLQLQAPDGVYMIQGNHDLVQGPSFDQRCRDRGVNLLVNECAVISNPRGAFQLLGVQWTYDWHAMRWAVAETLRNCRIGLFPIMLAHHPHCWDYARPANIPLTISGHTHGGQIMLTDSIGAGPLRFKYWSGRYTRDNCSLVVSNGIGNWFPLRVNAPAEIVHLTLHSRA